MAKTPSKSKGKQKPAQLLRPGLLAFALTLGWAARHEPAVFTIASLGVWLLGMLTTLILVRAALALLGPLFAVCGTLLGRALRHPQTQADP